MEQTRNELRRWEIWFAKQFHATNFQGGYAAACDWPGCPISDKVLSMVGLGQRRLTIGDALALAHHWDRGWMFHALGDLADGRSGPGDIQRLARRDLYDSADLARTVETALEDGRLTSGEIHDIKKQADQNLENAQEIARRVQDLKSGPFDHEEWRDG